MEENKVENIDVNQEENKAEEQNPNAEIVIQQPGKLKKALKWVIAGVVGGALFVAGLFTGKGMNDNGDEADGSAESEEGPTED